MTTVTCVRVYVCDVFTVHTKRLARRLMKMLTLVRVKSHVSHFDKVVSCLAPCVIASSPPTGRHCAT